MRMRVRNAKRWMVAVSAMALSGIGIAAVGAVGSSGATGPTTPTVLYSSLVSPSSAQNPPNEWWSLSYGGTNTTEFGDKVTLASASPITSATVMLDSQAVGTGTFPVPVTFTIYAPGGTGGSVGTVLATKTKTFQVPYRPAGNPTACAASTSSIFPGSNDGTQWFNPATGSCYYGVVFPAKFAFAAPYATLPSTVVYGISYNATSGPASSLNVLFSTESASGAVTTGSDTDPGNLFVQAGAGSNDVGGSTGELTCSTVPSSGSFAEYNTAVGSSGCGTNIQQGPGAPYEPIGFVPAVTLVSNP
jgi:hypothetical protein